MRKKEGVVDKEDQSQNCITTGDKAMMAMGGGTETVTSLAKTDHGDGLRPI